jgi:8-oxo-dGTP diphosphatase
MARAPVLAAGGIVLRQAEPPLIAVVRLRKRNEWVLPKGKLDDGETARDAAEREVLEETGHDVCVHEFLGTLVYESGGRSKIVHYWRMEASGGQAYELMDDVKAVDWLPLEAALERLSRSYERAFLEHVGPLALAAAAPARLSRPAKAKKQPVAEKRRRRPMVAPPAAPTIPVSAPPPTDVVPFASGQDQRPLVDSDGVEAETSAATTAPEVVAPSAEEIEIPAATTAMPVEEPQSGNHATAATTQVRRINLVQKMREWLRRAA